MNNNELRRKILLYLKNKDDDRLIVDEDTISDHLKTSLKEINGVVKNLIEENFLEKRRFAIGNRIYSNIKITQSGIDYLSSEEIRTFKIADDMLLEPIVLRIQISVQEGNRLRAIGQSVPRRGRPVVDTELPYSSLEMKAILKALEIGSFIAERFQENYISSLTSNGLLINGVLRGDLHQVIGERLFQTLFSGDLLPEYVAARDTGRPIACQLELTSNDVLLAQYPWELLYEGTELTVMRKGFELTRTIMSGAPPTPLYTNLPLRVLYIGPRPVGVELLGDDERESMWSSLSTLREAGLLEWVDLQPPTWDKLRSELDSNHYDMIHFDGHGVFARICTNCDTPHYPSMLECSNCGSSMKETWPEGYLYLADSHGRIDRVNVADMKAVLANSGTQLIVLTSCGSAIFQEARTYNGIAPALIQAGIPAVVAMQSSPPPQSMARFTEVLYRGLASSERLPQAVNNARRAIYRDKPKCWFMPVVYLRSSDTSRGQLFVLPNSGVT